MDKLQESKTRATIISRRIRERAELKARKKIDSFALSASDYEQDLVELAIAQEAWRHIISSGTDPKFVFVHPIMLQQSPDVSLHYRGIALLSLKRVQTIVGSVVSWEDRSWPKNRRPTTEKCQKIARLYNSIISSIIMDADDWVLENGYRNVLATIGITADGSIRNIIGREGEKAVQNALVAWLQTQSRIDLRPYTGTDTTEPTKDWMLSNEVRMTFGIDPDIAFKRKVRNGEWQIVATIEIKAGTDPAGALERLGAFQKSAGETPNTSKDYLIVGVCTAEMGKRLKALGFRLEQIFDLSEIINDPEKWEEFTQEIFHHGLRLL